jgi:hypothetical protein
MGPVWPELSPVFWNIVVPVRRRDRNGKGYPLGGVLVFSVAPCLDDRRAVRTTDI